LPAGVPVQHRIRLALRKLEYSMSKAFLIAQAGKLPLLLNGREWSALLYNKTLKKPYSIPLRI
jgi:hypothetical protein